MNSFLTLGADNGAPVAAPVRFLNRHGLIAGATGTGKSVSVIGMAEALQRLGVPSIVTDVKGDLSGLAAKSENETDGGRGGGAPWWPEAAAVELWDVFAEQGRPIKAGFSVFGAPLAARALGLSDAQTGVLEVAFAVAADYKMPLHTLADLRAVVSYCADNRQTIGARYGLVTLQSVAAISRAILRLERAGGADFFAAETTTLDAFTHGAAVHLLDCVRLVREPRLYGAVLLYLLDALARGLPERGDAPLPVLALFFDEAHLIFSDCPPDVVRAVEQTVRLIRSKGVCVFFASQSPSDLPDGIARQLHLRVQHGLRAVTPKDRAMLRAAADSMPPAEGFRVFDALEKLKTGQALVSFLDSSGAPTPTRLLDMQMPRCRLSPLTDAERAALLATQKPAAPVTPVAAHKQTTQAKKEAWPWYLKTALGLSGFYGLCFLVSLLLQ